MNFIVIGDMHLGKKILDITPNPFDTSIDVSTMHAMWSHGVIKHIKENIIPIAISSIHNVESYKWIFLGDILDYPRVPMMDEFKNLIDYILDQNKQWSIDILVGNHDTRKVGVADRTELTTLNGHRTRVAVYHEFALKPMEDKMVIYLPYIKTFQILPFFRFLKDQIPENLEVIVFSHNNIYLTDAFLTTPMIPKAKIEEQFGRPIILFNGHIHRSHYETNYYQVGSSTPTSFKETPQAAGCCLYIDGKVTVLRNNKIMLISISSSVYLRELEWYLQEARKMGTTLFLRIGRGVENETLEIVKRYKEVVPGIAFDSQKHT